MSSPFPNRSNRSSSPDNLLADLSLGSSTGSSFYPEGDEAGHDIEDDATPVKPLPGRGALGSLGLGLTTSSNSAASGSGARSLGIGRIQTKPRFSLFAAPSAPTNLLDRQQSRESNPALAEEEEEDEPQQEQHSFTDEGHDEEFDDGREGDGDETIHGGDTEPAEPEETPAQREQKLRESLYELKQMNEVFESFLGALESAKGHNERLAVRVSQTSALLDQYVALLGQTEHTQKLILNENWTGAEDDALAVAAEQQAAAEAAHQAQLAAEAEARRQEQELARLDREREMAAARAADPTKPTRGVARGRGLPRGRGIVGSSRGSGIPRVQAGTTTGIRKPSAGVGGAYANVKSSGYGPAPAAKRSA